MLVRAGSAQGYAEGTLLGVRDDPLSTLGRVHAQKTAELLMDIEASAHLTLALLSPSLVGPSSKMELGTIKACWNIQPTQLGNKGRLVTADNQRQTPSDSRTRNMVLARWSAGGTASYSGLSGLVLPACPVAPIAAGGRGLWGSMSLACPVAGATCASWLHVPCSCWV